VTTPLLQVENLRVEIATRHRDLVAIDDLSLSIGEGEVLGVVGESGPANPSPATQSSACWNGRPARPAAGYCSKDGVSTTSTRRRCAGCADDRSEPFSRTPLASPRSVDDDRLPASPDHHHASRYTARRGPRARGAAAGGSWYSGSARAARQLSARIVRRHAPTHRFWPWRSAASRASSSPTNPPPPSTCRVQAQVIDLLKRMCRERGTAVMLVTHDMGVIAEAADRVAVMYAGRVVETGPNYGRAARRAPSLQSRVDGIDPEHAARRAGPRPRRPADDPGRDAAPRRAAAGVRLSSSLPGGNSKMRARTASLCPRRTFRRGLLAGCRWSVWRSTRPCVT